MSSEMLGRLADRLCNCGYLLPSTSAIDPERHHHECAYRSFLQIGLGKMFYTYSVTVLQRFTQTKEYYDALDIEAKERESQALVVPKEL